MTIAQALTLAFQFVNQPMSDLAIAEMAQELDGYPLQHVLAALRRCRMELKAIRYADILDRLPGGHPGPEEAWSMVASAMRDESRSLIWSEEMREAYGVANQVADDPVQARMVFKETYTKAVSGARAERRHPKWSVSRGKDRADLERVLTEGIKQGRITAARAQQLLPHQDDPHLATLILEQLSPRLLS